MIVVASFEPFALWLAEHERPEWRGRALVSAHHDRVTGLSPVAKRAGVRLGMSLAGARQQAPELLVVESGGPYLQAAWASLVLEACAFSSRLEPLALGVVAFEGEAVDARQFAAAYRTRVGASTSVERARLLAVSSFAGSARVGGDASERALLERMPVRMLRGLGLGEKNHARLQWLGIARVGQLLAWKRAHLLAFLGPEGDAVARALFGPFRTRLSRFSPPACVSASVRFDEPACEPAQLVPALAQLVAEAVRALGDRSASLVSVKASAAGVVTRASRRAKEPSRDARRLLDLALLALGDTNADALGIDELALELGELQRGGVQEGLWQERPALKAAVMRVSARFPQALLRLVEVDPHAFEAERRFELRQAHSGALVPWREVTRAPDGAARSRSSPPAGPKPATAASR